MSTLDLPLGTVVTGGAFLIPGAIVRVSVERQDASTTINVQATSDDQSSGGESGEGSGRGKGRGGGDHRDDSVTAPDD